MIVAWHEVPGIAPPQNSRPVGHGMIPRVGAPIRRLEGGKFECGIAKRNRSDPKMHCGISCARSYRTLRDGSFEGRFAKHFVPGYDHTVPLGQKSHSPIEEHSH